MKKHKTFWGIFFLLAAVCILLSKTGILPDIGITTILLTIFSLWLLFDGIRYLEFCNITFALAFLYIIFDKPLGIELLTPWTAILVALLSGIGLSILFGGKRKKRHFAAKEYHWENRSSSEQCNGKNIICENNFGSAIRYINSDDFCNARVKNNFGSTTVYFDNVIIQKDCAYVDIENSFGETVLYIPKEWKIQTELNHSFGTVDEHGTPVGNSNATLYIRGNTSFGHIDIYYV
ncbi:MAG: LiaF-related protein [Roseburia sp.]|nr:LiaF-related protein [Roseburia sp.]